MWKIGIFISIFCRSMRYPLSSPLKCIIFPCIYQKIDDTKNSSINKSLVKNVVHSTCLCVLQRGKTEEKNDGRINRSTFSESHLFETRDVMLLSINNFFASKFFFCGFCFWWTDKFISFVDEMEKVLDTSEKMFT